MNKLIENISSINPLFERQSGAFNTPDNVAKGLFTFSALNYIRNFRTIVKERTTKWLTHEKSYYPVPVTWRYFHAFVSSVTMSLELPLLI